jgi:energy-coupling factor transport system ATP-binding protein
MPEPLIVCDGVEFSYPVQSGETLRALQGVSLSVSAGEHVAIIGPNGSGKSTLARHLNALLRPQRGAVHVRGMDTRDPARTRAIRQTVGMVFQQPDSQIVATIVEEDVAFGPENLGIPHAELQDRVRGALETVGMWEARARPPHLLSAGQKQRVAIAGVLAMHPACMVLDEATSLLDPQGRAEIGRVVAELRRRGTAIVSVTHRMSEAAAADRIVVLQRGTVRLEGPPRGVFGRGDLLQEIGLDLPPVTALAGRLRRQMPGFPADLLTVEELVEAVSSRAGPPAIIPRGPGEDLPTVRPAAQGTAEVPIIRIQDLWHTYMSDTPFEQVALRGVTLDVRPGEIVGIIGQTGSGKSSLIQYMNGLLRPLHGRVVVDGHDLGHRDVDVRAIRQMVGVVFQDPEDQVFEPLVGDDVAYGPRQLGLPLEEIRARVRWAMEAVGLPFEDFKDRYTFTLSGGELRRVALAGVLALRPRVLVLDEPTSGLDPGARVELWARIQDLRAREGLTLVLVSHDMDEVARLSDRVYVLDQGRVVTSGPPRAVFGDIPRLVALGLAPPEATLVCQRLRARGYRLPADVLTVEEAGDALAALLRQAS